MESPCHLITLDHPSNLKYHSTAMTPQPASRPGPSLLNLSAYFIVPAVALPALWELFQQDAPTRWLVSGLLAAFATLLLLRDRVFVQTETRSYVYTAVQTTLVTAIVWLPPHPLVVVVLFFVLSAEASMMFPPRALAAWITLFSTITVVAYLSFSPGVGLISATINIAGYIFFAVFAQQTARAEAARAQSQLLLDQLQEAHRQLQDYSAQAEDLAVSQERNRLAREMHDTLGHRLTVASVQLQAIERLIPSHPERALQLTGSTREQVKEALAELRRTVATLRAPIEADLALEPALRRLSAGFEQATGISVDLMLPQQPIDASAPQRQALYRGAQEGLTNIQKHAQATHAWLRLAAENNAIVLTVGDNGVGFGKSNGIDPSSFGLRGLRERTAQLGGTLSTATPAEGGAELILVLPVCCPQEASIPPGNVDG